MFSVKSVSETKESDSSINTTEYEKIKKVKKRKARKARQAKASHELKVAKELIISLQYLINKYERMMRDMVKELNKEVILGDEHIENPTDEEIIDMVLDRHPAFVRGFPF
jgi:hypothetical protein